MLGYCCQVSGTKVDTHNFERRARSLADHGGAFPVSDPLRAHHAAAPHQCLSTRLGLSPERCAAACPCPRVHRPNLKEGDALFIPEGWWHHVLTTGVEDASAAGQPVALAANIWWRGYAHEPAQARPYVLRRLIGDALARRTVAHVGRAAPLRETSTLVDDDATAMLAAAARRSRPPRHVAWRRALRTRGARLPHELGSAADSGGHTASALFDLLRGLDDAQSAALLASLDAAAADERDGMEAAAALRRLWRVVPQRAFVARWARHLHATAHRLLEAFCGLAPLNGAGGGSDGLGSVGGGRSATDQAECSEQGLHGG